MSVKNGGGGITVSLKRFQNKKSAYPPSALMLEQEQTEILILGTTMPISIKFSIYSRETGFEKGRGMELKPN